MNTVLRFAGIDVAKRHLDVFEESLGSRRFVNDPQGIELLVDWLGEGVVIGLEATGSHHQLASETLAHAGFAVHLYNPRQVRDLAKGLGILAKTDRIDARVIARCVKLVESPLTLRSPIAKQLRDLSRYIHYLTETRSDLKKKQHVCGLSELVANSIHRQIQALSAQINELEATWLQLLRTSPLHLNRYENLRTIPRIGKVSARVIVSELPEDLSGLSRKQLAAYFGLVPYDRQSGNSTGRSRLMHGNAFLRQPLFMVATLACDLDPECRELAQRLRLKGKHHLTVVCAVMHKLARRAIAVLLRNAPWEEQMPLPT